MLDYSISCAAVTPTPIRGDKTLMTDQPLWIPGPERRNRARMTAFMDWLATARGVRHADYPALYQWSITEPESFWLAVWDYCGVIASVRGDIVLEHGDQMPGARWFPGARLNYAENLLRYRDDADALVFWGEESVRRRLSRAELASHVSRFAQALSNAGVGEGDRVAGFLPNLPEAVVAMLATASLGAVWSSASPDFGVRGVLDRFGQIQPKALVCADGYFYDGKPLDSLARAADIAAALPSLAVVVVCSYTRDTFDLSTIPHAVRYDEFLAPYSDQALVFAPVEFDHPLFIMYSSGTTGAPKCIVHGHGGTLLQHLKEHQLHSDIRPGDRLFYFTTCGWMMWNWLASGLASGAALLLYDGSPFVGAGDLLFEYAEAERMTHFGASAKYLDALAKKGLRPGQRYRLEPLRALFSTGSPLSPEGFDFVYQEIKRDLCLSSISGGTDILSCFALGHPLLPVWKGELQCRGLGMAVAVYDEAGRSVRGQKGELVCEHPFPSMPIGFWNDPEGQKYRAAYFERYPNVWHHGDFCELTQHDGLIIYGRSDAVLNPGGVRIGTAEIYRQVEQLDEIVEAVVIGQNWPPEHPTDVRLVLFVKLRESLELTGALIEKIKRVIRENATPRHVPAKILAVPDIPRTRNGKIVELAVSHVVHGQPVRNIEALANPEALAYFQERVELRS